MNKPPLQLWNRTGFGYFCGLTMALGASVSFAAARAGILAGLSADDMIFARHLVAGVVMLPFVLHWGISDLAGIGWKRGAVLLVTGGPLFAMLQTGGYAFAPLAHGAVIAPSTVTILSTIGAGLILREKLTGMHILGAGIVLSGIIVISWQGFVESTSGESTWVGDVLFALSSVLWAGFTLLLRYWRLDAVRASALVAVLSMIVALPVYLAWHGADHVANLPMGALAVQGLMQGLVQGVITLLAYTCSIAILGVSRAVLFPAIVPAISILIGIPLIGEIPSRLQLVGLGLVSAGLLIAVGVLNRLSTRRSAP